MKRKAALALAALTALASPVGAAGRDALPDTPKATPSQRGIGNEWLRENRAKQPVRDTRTCMVLYDRDPKGEVMCFDMNGSQPGSRR